VRVQQDAQEFFNVICERLEKRLAKGPQAKVVKHLFGGALVNQMICHGGCGSVRENPEEFFTLSLQVKARNSLLESLESYVQGETLSDYACSTCSKRCDLTKRACIGALGNTVIMHLKRFDLNFETFQHDKLNNRFEFPVSINLEPFTKEGLARREAEQKSRSDASIQVPTMYNVRPRDYYRFQLVGIIVHTGTAQGGHYYSFIKDRKAIAPNATTLTIIPSNAPPVVSSASSTSIASEKKGDDVDDATSGLADDDDKKGTASSAPADAPSNGAIPANPSSDGKSDGKGDDGKGGEAKGSGGGDDKKAAEKVERERREREAREEKERQAAERAELERNSVWFEFNDHTIKPFQLADLENSTFGGQHDVVERGQWGYDVTRVEDRINNAYMLVYERVNPDAAFDPSAVVTEVKGDGKAESGPSNDAATTSVATSATASPVAVTDDKKSIDEDCGIPGDYLGRDLVDIIPEAILYRVHRDNVQFALDRQVYNKDYYNFVHETIKLLRLPEASHDEIAAACTPSTSPLITVSDSKTELKPSLANQDIVHFAARFALECICHGAENDMLPHYCRELRRLFDSQPSVARW
jgi:hypothetical protein